MPSDLAYPFLYVFSSLSDAQVADPRVFLKHTAIPHCLHLHHFALVLKLQSTSRAHSQPAPDIPRHGNLPLARQLRLPLHRRTPIPYFITSILTSPLLRAPRPLSPVFSLLISTLYPPSSLLLDSIAPLINDPDRSMWHRLQSVLLQMPNTLPTPVHPERSEAPQPAFDDPKHHLRIYQGDCLEILQNIPECSIDL